MAKLELRDVRKSFGTLEIIKGMSADIADGEFVVIVGPSGCGKSTLLRMIAGLEAITSGEILIGDRVVNQLEPKDRDIAMVFQNYALYPHMSVRQNMAYGLKIRGFAKDDIETRVQRAAKILELGELLARRARGVSGGERQRGAVGGAGGGGRVEGGGPGVFLLRGAAIQSGCQAAGADAAGNPEAAPQPRHHQRLCHPRPGRGDDAGRAHDRDERRPYRTDRRAR